MVQLYRRPFADLLRASVAMYLLRVAFVGEEGLGRSELGVSRRACGSARVSTRVQSSVVGTVLAVRKVVEDARDLRNMETNKNTDTGKDRHRQRQTQRQGCIWWSQVTSGIGRDATTETDFQPSSNSLLILRESNVTH